MIRPSRKEKLAAYEKLTSNTAGTACWLACSFEGDALGEVWSGGLDDIGGIAVAARLIMVAMAAFSAEPSAVMLPGSTLWNAAFMSTSTGETLYQFRT